MRLSREHRLRRSSEFRALTSRGRRARTRSFTLVHAPSPTGNTRLGMGVSRKVGNAVRRNRLRRRIREILRQRLTGSEGRDLLVIARPGACELEFTELEAELETLLQRAAANGGGTR